MEQHRIWHEPVVRVWCKGALPCLYWADLYDFGNRRWYRIEGDFDVDEHVEPEVDSGLDSDAGSDAELPFGNDRLCDTLSKHIQEHYHKHQTPPTWNLAHICKCGDLVDFETAPDLDDVDRDDFRYGQGPHDKLPTILFDEVREKRFLTFSIDRCVWNNTICMFKRLDFHNKAEDFEREIRSTEALMGILGEHSNVNEEMLNYFHIMPILAVVTDGSGPANSGKVLGFLMPFLGYTLDIIEEKSKPFDASEYAIPDLVQGVQRLGQHGVVHGDICFWGTVYDSQNDRLILMDMCVPPSLYEGDATCLSWLVRRCAANSSRFEEDDLAYERAEAAARELEEGNFDGALEILLPWQGLFGMIEEVPMVNAIEDLGYLHR